LALVYFVFIVGPGGERLAMMLFVAMGIAFLVFNRQIVDSGMPTWRRFGQTGSEAMYRWMCALTGALIALIAAIRLFSF
jgi:hypothetical protein